MTTAECVQQWDQLWLSLWPLASDDLHAGVYRCSRGEAMHRRFIETNPRALSNLLVVSLIAAIRNQRKQREDERPCVLEQSRQDQQHEDDERLHVATSPLWVVPGR